MRSRSMRAAFVAPADADVRIDDHHGFDMRRQRFEQAPDRARLLAIHAVIENAPAGLPQPRDRSIGRAVADQPDLVALGRAGSE